MSWPVAPSAYGSYDWLRQEIGIYMQWDADFNTWDHEKNGKADTCIQSGLKRFYFPPPLGEKDGAMERHKWSFLNPTTTLAIVAGTSTYELPDDFAGNIDAFTFGSNRRITMVKDSEIRSLQANENATAAAPKLAAIRPRKAEGAIKQQWYVEFYPTPDAAYTLSYSYQINPPAISQDNQSPLGGHGHSETILESVLAICEDRLKMVAGGPHQARFVERLGGSVQLDSLTKITGDQSWEVNEPAYGTYSYFSREVGGFMGYGHNTKAWTYQQDRRVNSIVQSGIRQAYNPPPVGDSVHLWSFLQPVVAATMESGTYNYDLPSDFGMVLSRMTYAADGKQLRVQVVNEEMIRSQRAKAFLNGPPKYVASRPKRGDYATQQGYEMVFYPTPDAAYEIEYSYNVSPPDAGTDREYPLGTRSHAELFLASCLASAECARDGKRGDMYAKFTERLAASVQLDMMARQGAMPAGVGE